MPDTTVISWCPKGIGLRKADGESSVGSLETFEDEQLLPPLNHINNCNCIYLPLENMLVRPFSFPLKHPKYLDKDILLEELADTAGIEPDDWWVTWQAKAVQDGIAGMAFGIRQDLKEELANTSPWQSSPLLLIDGWQRLNHWLDDKSADTAVIDVDAEGVFLGVFRQGTWFGIRRLNADMNDASVREAIAKETLWSLQSMGFKPEAMSVTGRITPEFKVLLNTLEEQSQSGVEPNIQSSTQSHAQIESTLPERCMLNLALPTPATSDKHVLNVRHGSWASRSTSPNLQVWFRPAILAVMVCLLWVGITVVSNYRLESQISAMNDEIEAAFHRGLPEQPVIIDALAQLKQAAGGNGSASQSNVGQELYNVSQVFKETPWQMQSINIGKDITLAGKVNSLDILNTIKDKLTKRTQSDVQIADTDLKGDEVSFRMRWQ